MYYNSKSYFGMELNGVIRDEIILNENDNMKKIYK